MYPGIERILTLVILGVMLHTNARHADAQSSGAVEHVVAADLLKDYDGDRIPDRLGERVTLAGRVSLGKMMSPRFNSAYLQDHTGGIRIDDGRGLGEIIYGDSIRVAGVVRRDGSRVFIDLEQIDVLATDRTILPEVKAHGNDPNLTPYVGLVTSVEGYVISKAADAGGTILLVNRKAGPIAIRISNRSPRSVAWTSRAGEYIRATGVLDLYKDDDPYSYQLYTRSDSDLERVLIPPPVYPWAGGILVGMLSYLLLTFGKRLRSTLKSRERKYKALFELVGTPMVVADSSLRVVDANKAACRLLRQSRTQMRFRRLTQYLKKGGDDDLAGIAERLTIGSIESFAAGVWNEEVGNVEVEVILSRVRMGRNEFIVATLHDVSDHLEAISEFQRFHEDLLNGVPVEVAVLTPSGKYVYANDKVGFGEIPADWLNGKSDLELCRRLGIPAEVALRRRAHRRRAVSSGELVDFEEEIEVHNEIRHYLRSYVPVAVDAGGEISAVASYAVDITEVRVARTHLETARREVDKVVQLKEAFLDNVNQEFRKPITGIIGFAEILEGEVSEEQREFVGLIERNGRRLMNTLNAVLDLAGLSNNEFDLNPQVLNIVDEITQMINESRDAAEEKGLFLKIEASEGEILGLADQACLSRVVQNLMDNSIKFTDAGGVIVEVEQDDQKVNIRVMDTGKGVDGEPVGRSFEELATDGVEATSGDRGAGVGLGITKRLVELMNGRIEMESDKEGSMFLISLPRAFPKMGGDRSALPKILLAEESMDVHMMVRYVLQDYFQVDVAEDIETLYRQTRRANYDVVLVDLGLSAAGYRAIVEVLDKIRTRRWYRNIPFVAMEDAGRRTDQDRIRADGFNYFLSKPHRRQELLNLLSRVMAERDVVQDDEGDVIDQQDDTTFLRKSA